MSECLSSSSLLLSELVDSSDELSPSSSSLSEDELSVGSSLSEEEKEGEGGGGERRRGRSRRRGRERGGGGRENENVYRLNQCFSAYQVEFSVGSEDRIAQLSRFEAPVQSLCVNNHQ